MCENPGLMNNGIWSQARVIDQLQMWREIGRFKHEPAGFGWVGNPTQGARRARLRRQCVERLSRDTHSTTTAQWSNPFAALQLAR